MKRILVCLDGSMRARGVLASAVDLARRTGAKLLVFRAVSLPPELPAAIHSTSPNDIPNLLLEHARNEVGELARDVSPALIDGVITHIGAPRDAICSAALEYDVDLIVLGAHGYGGLDRILGTTAAKVVNHADRSVLVVRSPGERTR